MNFRRPTSCLVAAAIVGLASIGNALAGNPVVILSEGHASASWQPTRSPLPAYPIGLVQSSDDVCINIGYMIDRDGGTSNYALLKTWSSSRPEGSRRGKDLDVFAQSAVAALQQWKFAPVRAGQAPPIYTSASFAFTRAGQAGAGDVRSRCAVPDLREHIEHALAEAFRRGDLSKGLVDRSQVERLRYIPMRTRTHGVQ